MGVVAAAPGSPAAKAGFTTGDMVESIQGIATRDMPLAYAALLLQGEAGTTVDLSVVRVRQPEPQTVKLTLAKLESPPVASAMLSGQVGYLNIDALGPAQVKQTADASREAAKGRARRS